MCQKHNYTTICLINCRRTLQKWLLQTKRIAAKKYSKFLHKFYCAWRNIVKHFVDTRRMYTFRLSFQFQRTILVKAWKGFKYGLELYKREAAAAVIGRRIRKYDTFLMWKKAINNRFVVANVMNSYVQRKLTLVFRYWQLRIKSTLRQKEKLLNLSISAWKKMLKSLKYHNSKCLRVTYSAWIRFVELKHTKKEYSKRLVLIRAAFEQVFYRHHTQKIRILEKYFLKLKIESSKSTNISTFSYRRELPAQPLPAQPQFVDGGNSTYIGVLSSSKNSRTPSGSRISKVEQHINTLNNLRIQASQIRSVHKVTLVGESIRNDREMLESRIKKNNQTTTPLEASKIKKDRFNIDYITDNSDLYESIIANEVSSVMDINELQ